MNVCIFTGRVTKDTEINTSGKVASNSLAVDTFTNGENVTSFISLKFLGENQASRAFKLLKKGTKICVFCRYNVGHYKDKDGNNRQTHDMIVMQWEFCESKKSAGLSSDPGASSLANIAGLTADTSGFMSIPDDMDMGSLPFN